MAQAVGAPGGAAGGSAARGAGARAAGGSKWWVLVVAIFGVFVSILDSTIVNTAIPKIQAVFGADLHQSSYISTGYTLAAGVVVGASGYLANRFGIKRIFLGSLTLFTIGSALCGLSWNIGSLIFFRVLQGAGGAALFPLAIALIFAVFPPEERGAVNGFFGIPVLFAPAIGPTLGGYIVQYIDWRWIFYVNVPIGIVGVVIGLRSLPAPAPQTGLRFDLRGFLILAAGLALLLYGLSNLAYDGWGSVTTVSGPTIAAVLLLLLWIPVELNTPTPLLDLRLFKERNFLWGNIIIWVATIGLFGAAFLLPQYLQRLRGLDPYTSGLQLLPQGLASIVATVLAGLLYNRVGPRVLIALGAAALAYDTFLLAGVSTPTAAFAALTPILILRGLALPPLAQTSNTLALQGVQGAALAGASTLIVVGRQVVASLAVAVLTNILQTQTLVHNAGLAARVNLTDPAVAAMYNGAVARFEARGLTPGAATGAALAQMAGQVQAQASALAFQDVYVISALIVIPAILLPFLLRPQKLRQGTGASALAGE